jgi:predicted hotdog family 3-hydroxylacyl-ACP dehydratase
MISELAKYLPHESPMVLVDRLVKYNDEEIVVEALIKNSYPFSNSTGAWIGLEFMAQAAGVHAELTRIDSGGEVKIGFLLGTRRFDSSISEFDVGTIILITVRKEFTADNGVSAATGYIHDLDGRLLCEAGLTLFQAKNNSDFLKHEA